MEQGAGERWAPLVLPALTHIPAPAPPASQSITQLAVWWFVPFLCFCGGCGDGFPHRTCLPPFVPRTSEYIWWCGPIEAAGGMTVVHSLALKIGRWSWITPVGSAGPLPKRGRARQETRVSLGEKGSTPRCCLWGQRKGPQSKQPAASRSWKRQGNRLIPGSPRRNATLPAPWF